MKVVKAHEELTRLWQNIPVEDATESLPLFCGVEDIRKATRKDPGCCALAKACERAFGSKHVMFNSTKALVELPAGSDGSVVVKRYDLDAKTRDFIRRFDAGEEVESGFVTLRPVRPSERLDSKSKRERGRRSEQRRKAAAAANPQAVKKKLTKKAKSKRRQGKAVAAVVRSGTGKVRTTAGKAHGKPPAK